MNEISVHDLELECRNTSKEGAKEKFKTVPGKCKDVVQGIESSIIWGQYGKECSRVPMKLEVEDYIRTDRSSWVS